MAKKKIRSSVIKANARTVLGNAIDRGIIIGWNRAHKHTETPSPVTIQTEIESAIWVEIDESFDFEGR